MCDCRIVSKKRRGNNNKYELLKNSNNNNNGKEDSLSPFSRPENLSLEMLLKADSIPTEICGGSCENISNKTKKLNTDNV